MANDLAGISSDIAVSSYYSWLKGLALQIFNDVPFLAWLLKNGNIRLVNGGQGIKQPVMYRKNTTIKSMAMLDYFDVTTSKVLENYVYPWKKVGGSIIIADEEERANAQNIIGLLDARTKQAKQSLNDIVSAMMYSDGSGNDGKDLLGLAAIVADDPTTGTIGGVSRSANSWARNIVKTGAKDTAAYDELLKKMRGMYRDTTSGTEHTNFIVCDSDTVDGYEDLIDGKVRYAEKDKVNVGNTSVMFKGATVIFDNDCPSTATLGRMYFLNSNTLFLTVDTKNNFVGTPFAKADRQDAKVSYLKMMGNLVTNNPRLNGVIKGIEKT